MTPEQAVKILELLKDHINDDGKRELSAVQAAIGSWRFEPDPPPAPEVKAETPPVVPLEASPVFKKAKTVLKKAKARK